MTDQETLTTLEYHVKPRNIFFKIPDDFDSIEIELVADIKAFTIEMRDSKIILKKCEDREFYNDRPT
jgi:hypothetical protein